MSRVDRYQNPEVYERLAAEYALGTLQGHARRRFLRLMDERPYIRHAVESWQWRLDPLADGLQPVDPPARIWHRIHQELGTERVTESWWDNLGLWRMATATALVLLVMTLVLPVVPQRAEPLAQTRYVAVLESPDAGPMMVATGTGTGPNKPWALTVTLMHEADMGPEEEMRLWCYPEDGGRPIPMGLIAAEGPTVFRLTGKEWENMATMTHLGISVEPKGSKDMPEPQGPIKYKGALMTLSI